MWVFLLSALVTAQTCNEDCSLILGAVNYERSLVGAKPVCINSNLMRAARVQAAHQHSIKTMTHSGPGGSNIGDRVTAQGYQWSQASENVAFGQTTAKSVMLGWMNSEGHRKNILNPNVSQMGIDKVGEYWAQAFAEPRAGATCDVAVPGGRLGTREPILPDFGPTCDSFCQSVLQVVNSKRAQLGSIPLCVNGKLMTAAQKIAQAKNLNNLQVEVDNTGFGTKGVGAAEHSIRLSRGLPSDKHILDMFNKDYKGSGNGKTFNRVGIASDSRREFWVIIEAGTYTPDEDKCQTGGGVAAITPPASTGVVSTTTAQQPPSATCSKITDPCKCLGRCGWSSGANACRVASTSTFTDCNECSTQSGCSGAGR